MMKKTLRVKHYYMLEEQLENAVKEGHISDEQANAILSNYPVSEGFSAMKAWLGVGAVLVGVGLLFLVWANWDAIANFWRVLLILFALSTALGASYFLRETQPMTAEAFWYLSAIIYGAGLFLIVDSFQLSITQSFIFFLWALGPVVLGVLRASGLMLLGAIGLLSLSILVGFNDALMVRTALVIVGLFTLNITLVPKPYLTTLLSVLGLLWLYHLLQYYNTEAVVIGLVYVMIGALLYHLPILFNRKATQQSAIISLGIGGFILTFPVIWTRLDFVETGSVMSTLFVLVFCVYLLWLLWQAEPATLVIIAALILRYSLDSSYTIAFRALIFIMGGLILLVGGFYFEWRRQRHVKQIS